MNDNNNKNQNDLAAWLIGLMCFAVCLFAKIFFDSGDAGYIVEHDYSSVFITLVLIISAFFVIHFWLKKRIQRAKVEKEVDRVRRKQKEKLQIQQQEMFNGDKELQCRKEIIDQSIQQDRNPNIYEKLSDINENMLNEFSLEQIINEDGKVVRYKKGVGVEGIVAGREYNQIDKDKDGRILISEVYPLTETEVLEKILAVDSGFSKSEFKSFVRSVFMLIQKAWSNNDYLGLRLLEADSLYYEHKIKIQELIDKGIVDKRENIRIKGVLLKDFRVEGNREILVVALTAKMDRKFDDDVFKSSEVIKPLNKNSGNVPYIMTFMRKKGLISKYDRDLAKSNCSNCGAIVNWKDDGICTYCGTSMVTGDIDWILTDIKNVELVEF